MKRVAVVLLAGALAALILQPVTCTVNTLSGNSGLWADGWPPPPFPPALGVGGAPAGVFLS
jgi:hypothetical protein